MVGKSFNRVVVDTAALEHNFRLMQNLAGQQVPLMAMVKADAYGHGMIKASESFARAGCDRFGVAELREGVLLRQSGITGEIYVTIGFDLGSVEGIFQHDLIPVVYSYEAARALAQYGTSQGREIGIHIKVDTGMSRLGMQVEEVAPFLDRISTLPAIRVKGLMSHFAEADLPDSNTTIVATQKFQDLCRDMKNRLGTICHIANSGAVINFPDACFDMVRVGIALYGYHPAGASHTISRMQAQLRPAMSFSTRILQVKELKAGTGISYGHTYITKKMTRIAVLPVGYEDGYSRALSNKGFVLIRGKAAPVCGRVCMNMCMVDVTDIDGVQAGDEAVIMGSSQSSVITADDIAERIGSISYEILCMIGNNNKREYPEIH